MVYFKNKKVTVLFITFIFTISVLWFTGIIPSNIARISAENYVKSNYKDKKLKFVRVEIPKSFRNYFVTFKDNNKKEYSFVLSRYIPTNIMYDPISPPG